MRSFHTIDATAAVCEMYELFARIRHAAHDTVQNIAALKEYIRGMRDGQTVTIIPQDTDYYYDD